MPKSIDDQITELEINVKLAKKIAKELKSPSKWHLFYIREMNRAIKLLKVLRIPRDE